MFYWDTVATHRALARDQHFVKVMPRDFVGERLSGIGGLPIKNYRRASHVGAQESSPSTRHNISCQRN